jgi:hypothetical protein
MIQLLVGLFFLMLDGMTVTRTKGVLRKTIGVGVIDVHTKCPLKGGSFPRIKVVGSWSSSR